MYIKIYTQHSVRNMITFLKTLPTEAARRKCGCIAKAIVHDYFLDVVCLSHLDYTIALKGVQSGILYLFGRLEASRLFIAIST